MSVATETNFGVGRYWTAEGLEAVVDAVADGLLIGRINLRDERHENDVWHACAWRLSGESYPVSSSTNLRHERVRRVKGVYWVNIYPSGPGQLRKTWEEALIEASGRQSEDALARVKVQVNAAVGEGLK